MLFATEGFESFNAIIRSASIHSNRHAPSRDIAHRMAKGNRVRHLMGGGVFLMNRLKNSSQRRTHINPQNISTWMEQVKDPVSLTWHCAGPEALNLLHILDFGDEILGLSNYEEPEVKTGTNHSP